MKATLKSLILLTLAFGAMLTACDSPAQRYERARTLYEEGTELREQRLSEQAAERFLQALSLMEGCEETTENLRLEGQIKDNLGAMYNKHGLFDDALKMHREAIACFRQVDDSADVMAAMRNCGRVANALEQFAQAKRYYDTAFSIATLLDDKAMQSDLYLEMGRDYYLPVGNFPDAMTCITRALEGELDDNNTDIANMTMGVLYYYTKNYTEAKPYLNAALRSERAGLKMSVYQTLYAIAYNEGDYEKALEYQDLFTQNMMQSDQEHASENLQRLKAEYELKAQKSEMESLLRNRSLKLWLIIAAAVIALLVIVLIVRKKVSDHKLAMEQFRGQMERDQNRIHELVSDMENLIRTNDDLRRDRQTLSQKELMMTNKIMGRNKIYTTAQGLVDQVTADTMSFALTDADWADFIGLTDLVYDGFSQRLLELYPKLGKWDVRICCLSKNGFSNQVISILLDTQTDSYYKRKTRIKQMKMDLGEDTRTFEEIVNAV
ncbi:MAG: tetratricopeptide repeat protein [Bacteroidales bacterium]|nr:tetratricopeptide repeat protein [Bacteroidales bacterium]